MDSGTTAAPPVSAASDEDSPFPAADNTNGGHGLDRRPRSANLQCCCGRLDCALLRKNCSALQSLEKDVHRAGQMGKVSLPPRLARCLGAMA
jgi:hypothetical protein